MDRDSGNGRQSAVPGDEVPEGEELQAEEETDPVPQDFPPDLLLAGMPDPGSIDAYLADLLSYDNNPYYSRGMGSHHPSLSQEIPLSQILPETTLEEATRDLSLERDPASFYRIPQPSASAQPALPDQYFGFPPANLQSLGHGQGSLIPPASPNLQSLGHGHGSLFSPEDQGPMFRGSDLIDPDESPEQERPGLQRYGLRSRSASQRKSFAESLESEKSDKSESYSQSSGHSAPAKRPRGGVLGRAVSTVGHTVGHAVKGGAAAVAQALPQRRSRDPAVIKEKAKARNRRAQKNFRARQKALQEERTVSMKSLQENLQHLGAENETLHAQVAALQESQQEFIEKDRIDPYTYEFVPHEIGGEPLTVSYDPAAVRIIQPDSLKEMKTEELVQLWKGYVDRLATLIAQKAISTEATDPSTTQIQYAMNSLLLELARLTHALAVFQPRMFLQFQNINMTTLKEEKAPRSHWRSVIGTLQMDEQQIAGILEYRRSAIGKLAHLLEHRNRLLSIQVQMLEAIKQDKDVHTKDIVLKHQEALIVLGELNDNLKAEQALIVRDMNTLQQVILREEQLAQFIVGAWPYYPGKMEAASILAQLQGEPATSLLLDAGFQKASELSVPIRD